jgi:hypothetical protein
MSKIGRGDVSRNVRTQNGGGNHLENVHYDDGEGDGRSALMWTVEE